MTPLATRPLSLIWLTLAAAGLLTACPGDPPDEDPSDTPATPTQTATATVTPTPSPTPTATLPAGERPSISIVNPRGDGVNPVAISLDGDLALPVFVVANNIALKAAGTCGPEDGLCGHVRLHLDGDAGNQPDLSYNAEGVTNPIYADFSALGDPSGVHTLTAGLFGDDGRAIETAAGPVAFSVDVVVAADLTLAISLTQDQRLRLGNDSLRSVNIPFALSNFTLKAPGTCGGAARCGHLYVKIDGDGGDAPGLAYNAIASAAPAQARFAYVDTPEGTHTVTLSLRSDTGAVIQRDGAPVEDSVRVITQEVSPQLTVLSPAEGSQALLNEQGNVSLVFAATNFTLADPGTCPASALPDCGFVEVKVDGDAGDQPGQAYNARASQSPALADMDVLEDPGGYHTFKLRLMRDSGDPAVVRGEAVEAQVTVLVVEAEDPYIRFLAPSNGDDVVLGTDTRMTVPVSFALANFRLAPPGTCGGKADCGHMHLLLDGPAGNEPGLPYNNLVTSGPSGVVDAYFDRLPEPTGNHRIALSLRDDAGAPYFLDGNPVEVSIAVSVSTGVPTLDIVGIVDGQRVRLGADEDLTVRVPFRAENFTVRPPGSCTGEEPNACGYVEVSVDGAVTGETGSNPALAYFAGLIEPLGEHTIALRLMSASGNPILVDGQEVVSQVVVVAQEPQEPYVRIVTPVDGGLVTLNTDLLAAPVSFSVVNFALTEPGDPCPPREEGADVPCGYAVLKIDGDAGDRGGAPYNNVAMSPVPVLAYFEGLSPVEGPHRLSLTLFEHGSVTPVTLTGGLVASDTVDIAVSVVDEPIDLPDDPILTVLRPQELGDSPARVTLSGGYGLDVAFQAFNVTLKAPGACTTADGVCGHVRVDVDGDAGDLPGQTYNGLGAMSPVVADFTQVAEPAGTHTLRVYLAKDGGGPITTAAGAPVEVSLLVDVDTTPDVTLLLIDGVPLALDNTADRGALAPFRVTNYDLKAPGTCGGAPRCGHVAVKIDGDQGDVEGEDYNNRVFANPAEAHFGRLGDPEGIHNLTLELRDDSGRQVQVGGRGAQSTVLVETRSVAPDIAILTPGDGAQVRLVGEGGGSIPLSLGPTRFLLREPGACTADELPDCGYGVIKVDGDAGDQPDEAYNALATGVAAFADFSVLGTPTGPHRITVELRRNGGQPVKVGGETVMDKVDVLVTQEEDPILRLIYPTSYELTTVPLGTDAALTVPISFTLNGFALQPPGTCGDAELCGHLYVKLDGDAGDLGGDPYNNRVTSGPIGFTEAYFIALSEPTGAHTLTLSLRRDDGSPFTLYGAPVEVSAFLNAEYALPELQILGLSEGQHVRLVEDETEPFLPVTYQTRNFVQEAPGGCDGDELERCGYVEMYLDGVYKGVSDLNPAQIPFAGVTPLTGSHVLRLALVDTDGEPIVVEGAPVEDSVAVVVQARSQPFIRIVSPQEGDEITLVGETLSTFITFLTDGFRPTSPGDPCDPQPDGTVVTCGYVIVKIDGEAGNRPFREYNNIWYTPAPVPAIFSFLDRPAGAHEVTLTLYDHGTQQPITGPGGIVSEASVRVVTQLPPD